MGGNSRPVTRLRAGLAQVYIFGSGRSQPELFGGLPRADPVISIGCVSNTMVAVTDSGSLFR